MFRDLRADLRRFHRSAEPLAPWTAARLILEHFGLQVLVVYRGARVVETRASASSRSPWRILRPVTRRLASWTGQLYGIYLDPRAEIGPGLYIGHSGGIHVGESRLGSGCSIHQRVTIAPARAGEEGPVVGDGVWIGCHATIAGAFRIGDGATVGAGAAVTKDVPGRSLVLGSPSRVVQRDYDNTPIM